MTTLNTCFNPFGAHEKTVESLKNQLIVDVEGFDPKTNFTIGILLENLTKVCKEIDETAVQSLLSEINVPLVKLARNLSEHTDLVGLCRSLGKFVQTVADRVVEPFTSDLLVQWADLFESLISAKTILLRDSGVVLWKATFGTVKGSLRYPGDLRQTLAKLPKKNGIVLPPEEKKTEEVILFAAEDEEAMDGMGTSSSSSSPSSLSEKPSLEVTKPESASQSTFQLSQQPDADEITEKLLKEAQVKAEKEKNSTPTRRRASKMPSLLDEDSCDFVAIVATPPSAKKHRLTDRQKEKLAEATGPRTTINYVDEESQSGFQKTEQMKAALTALNYDVGEESVSVCVPTPKNDPIVDEKPMEEETPAAPLSTRRSSKRSRKSPVAASPSVAKSAEQDEEELAKVAKLAKTPPRKGRPKKKVAPEAVTVQEVPNKRARSLTTMPTTTTTLQKKPSSDEVTLHQLQKSVEVEPSPLITDTAENPVSPPKTPRTPSILRVAKRFDGSPSILRRLDSPQTERKRNRVHFGEESLPQDQPTSQVVLAVDVNLKSTSENPSPSKIIEIPDSPRGLLEIPNPASTTSPFFRSLVGCNDPIDKVVRKLAPLCLKTAVDAVKKSLQKAGIKTIGEFASLTKKQLNDISGLKHPKEKCARSVLQEYEAKKRAETRASEERITADETPLKQMPMIVDCLPVDTPFQPIPKIVETPEPEEEKASESPASPIAAKVVDTNPQEEVRKNLAPIFDKTKVKLEVLSPQKVVKAKGTSSMIDDSQLLHRICSNLSRAHSLNQLPTEKWSNFLNTVNKSAILFKNIVQDRGTRLAEWDDVDMENQTCDDVLAPEDDVKMLRDVYRRFSRHHTLGDVTDDTWRGVMETVNEAAVLLRSIVVERASKF
uniref:Uncharacterized protein n=1 Tax=Caenorhabditis japonica TaxID=281687 RepID=A0A8R1DUV0_CAEJA